MKKREKKYTASDKIFKVLRTKNHILRQYGVVKMGLFGSFSRGENKKNSDIDFIVEFKKASFDNFMNLAFYLEDLFRKKVELITPGNLSPYVYPYVEKEIKWYEA